MLILKLKLNMKFVLHYISIKINIKRVNVVKLFLRFDNILFILICVLLTLDVTLNINAHMHIEMPQNDKYNMFYTLLYKQMVYISVMTVIKVIFRFLIVNNIKIIIANHRRKNIAI